MKTKNELVESSKAVRDDELGPYKDFMPIIQLLATAVEAAWEDKGALIKNTEFNRLMRVYYQHEMTRIFVRTRRQKQDEVPLVDWQVTKTKKFSARITDTNSLPRIEISLGAFHSLSDLALRACCSENFCNPLPGDPYFNLRWKGGRTRQLSSKIQPVARFRDYSPGFWNSEMQVVQPIAAEQLLEMQIGVIPYVSRLPISPERLQLAHNVVLIAVTWIFLHEEAHAKLGHLDEVANGPTNSRRSIEMESEADSYASERIFSTYLHDDTAFECLGLGVKGDLRWRITMVSAGIALAITAISINEKRSFGDTSHPPSDKRLLRASLSIFRIFVDGTLTYRGESIFDFSGQSPIRLEADGVAYDTYDYVSGIIWEYLVIDELLRQDFAIYNFTNQNELFHGEHSSILLATALARRLEGRLDLDDQSEKTVISRSGNPNLAQAFSILQQRYNLDLEELRAEWENVVKRVRSV